MAPEIMLGKNQSSAVDVWALGILLYELLHGKPPYHGQTQSQKLDQMKKGTPVNFDNQLSQDCKHLLQTLLDPNELSRIKMDLVFCHPWMKNFEATFKLDFGDLRSRRGQGGRSLQSKGSLGDRGIGAYVNPKESFGNSSNPTPWGGQGNKFAQEKNWKLELDNFSDPNLSKLKSEREERIDVFKNRVNTYKNYAEDDLDGKPTVRRKDFQRLNNLTIKDEEKPWWMVFRAFCCTHREMK
jgi:serine/threonine protein kinase